jgi:hypothetical protein
VLPQQTAASPRRQAASRIFTYQVDGEIFAPMSPERFPGSCADSSINNLNRQRNNFHSKFNAHTLPASSSSNSHNKMPPLVLFDR